MDLLKKEELPLSGLVKSEEDNCPQYVTIDGGRDHTHEFRSFIHKKADKYLNTSSDECE